MNAVNGQAGRRNDPNAVLNDCRELNRGIDEVESKVNELRGLYITTTSITAADELEQHNSKIERVQENTMTLYRNLVERMRRIKSNPESGNPRNEKQVGATDRRLRTALNNYQKADAEYRSRLQEQKRRQYLTIRPDASEAELQEAMEDTSANQFQQAVSLITSILVALLTSL